MTYDEEVINQIVENIDLLEYVGESIDLTTRGSDYFGRCPLHIDKTPSFSVTPSKNRFFCFGCGRGGTIIQYLVEYEGLKYSDAVQKAAQLSNVDLRSMCQSQTVQYNKSLKRIRMQSQPTVTHKILDKTLYNKFKKEAAPEWMNEGIKKDIMDLFEVRIDTGANRIVYPVYDNQGNFINVKGRTRYADYKKLGISKYINYYPVGVLDYFQGLTVNRSPIEQTHELLIFEGIKSVMKLRGFGKMNAVSAEKHDLTKEQIAWIIQSNVRNVVLCYDSDVSYSEQAVKKNLSVLRRYVNLYIVTDPKELLGGAEAKNSPVDKGIDIWNELYSNRRRIL